MRRQPKAYFWYGPDYDPAPVNCGGREVYVPYESDGLQATGVLNARGEMLYRVPEPIGFRLGRKE